MHNSAIHTAKVSRVRPAMLRPLIVRLTDRLDNAHGLSYLLLLICGAWLSICCAVGCNEIGRWLRGM
jgi:hypothetical protein